MTTYANNSALIQNITASEKQSLVWALEEEAEVTRLMMEQAAAHGLVSRAASLEEELEGQDAYIRAVKEGCA